MAYRGGADSVYYQCGEDTIVAALYSSAGDEPKPAAVLIHGTPGSEKNFDIAYRLRELGWHVLIPSVRGSWGSGGDYNFPGQPDDAIAGIDYLLNAHAEWKIDPARIAVVGYSIGSRAALVATHRDPRVKAVVSLAGVADFDEIRLSNDFYASAKPFLRNSSPEKMQQQWGRLGGAENPVMVISTLQRPVLIVHGTEDEVVPYYMAPALAEAAGSNGKLVTIEGADHTFTHQRRELVDTVTDWLAGWAQPSAAGL